MQRAQHPFPWPNQPRRASPAAAPGPRDPYKALNEPFCCCVFGKNYGIRCKKFTTPTTIVMMVVVGDGGDGGDGDGGVVVAISG